MDKLTVTVHMDKWCVYQHSVEGHIIYIGMGNLMRPFITYNRSDLWNKLIGKSELSVKILGWFDERQEAVSYERKMVSLLSPPANKNLIRISKNRYGIADTFIYDKNKSAVLNAITRFGSQAKLADHLSKITSGRYRQSHISGWKKNGGFPADLQMVIPEMFDYIISAYEACPTIKRAVHNG